MDTVETVSCNVLIEISSASDTHFSSGLECATKSYFKLTSKMWKACWNNTCNNNLQHIITLTKRHFHSCIMFNYSSNCYASGGYGTHQQHSPCRRLTKLSNKGVCERNYGQGQWKRRLSSKIVAQWFGVIVFSARLSPAMYWPNCHWVPADIKFTRRLPLSANGSVSCICNAHFTNSVFF